MKRILLLFALMAGMLSCVDSDYDLSNIENDDFTIGDESSEFRLPMATVNFSARRLSKSSDEGEISFMELYDEVNIWLPSQMPDGKDYVEVERLSVDEHYLLSIEEALIDEMLHSEEKLNEVSLLIAKSYRNRFISALLLHVPAEELELLRSVSDEQAAQIIASLFVEYNEQVSVAVADLASTYMVNMHLEDVLYDIPALNLSSDIEKMLTENLDPATVENPKNALYIYGTIESEFPFVFKIEPSLRGTMIALGEIVVSEGETNIDEVRFYREDMHHIFEGTTLVMPVVVDRYYYKRPITESMQIDIHLYLRKTGGLTL